MIRLLLTWITVVICASPVYAGNLTLWYDTPAKPGMNEALPIGNGRFGGLIYAGPKQERVVLNESSLWTGKEISTEDYSKMGSYQMLGELLVDFAPDAASGAVQSYRRALDLATAIHQVTYQYGGVTCRREAFASHPDQVMVLRLSADRPGACSGTVGLRGAHKERTAAVGGTLTFAGALDNGLKYEAKVVALNKGGTVEAGDGRLEFKNCDTLTLLVAAGTDYALDYRRHYRGEDPHTTIEKRLAAAGAKEYDELKAEHIAEHESWFNRVALDVGTTPADRVALPIDRRKVLHAEHGGDPELETILFQYGRYLLISCSRPGGLPANLQGLWNDSNDPPWHSDYHANINIQMNYWPAEPANLAECHTPLFDLIVSQLEPWRKATAAEKRFAAASGKSSGWAVRTSHGIDGDEGW
jgi:alpha-L-fucosidase 2